MRSVDQRLEGISPTHREGVIEPVGERCRGAEGEAAELAATPRPLRRGPEPVATPGFSRRDPRIIDVEVDPQRLVRGPARCDAPAFDGARVDPVDGAQHDGVLKAFGGLILIALHRGPRRIEAKPAMTLAEAAAGKLLDEEVERRAASIPRVHQGQREGASAVPLATQREIVTVAVGAGITQHDVADER